MNSFDIYRWRISGVELYDILLWFFIYSFLGWVWESCYVSIKERKWVNRGFVSGPCLTIYGFGAVSVYLLLRSLPRNVVVLYIGGVIVATILEYITAVVMEGMFHTSWWDYSEKKFNFQGRICLTSSLFWGVMTLLLFYVFQPIITTLTSYLTMFWGELIVTISITLYVVDFVFAFIAASNMVTKVRSLNTILEEWIGFMKDSKLYESTDDLKAKIYHLRHYVSDKKAEILLMKKEKEVMERWDNLYAPDYNEDDRNQFQEKIHEYVDKLLSSKATQGRNIKRLLNAYPRLGKLTRKRREKDEETL